jgi:hypothetical protein
MMHRSSLRITTDLTLLIVSEFIRFRVYLINHLACLLQRADGWITHRTLLNQLVGYEYMLSHKGIDSVDKQIHIHNQIQPMQQARKISEHKL